MPPDHVSQEIAAKLGELTGEVRMLRSQVSAMAGDVTDMSSRLAVLERDVSLLREETGKIQKRIADGDASFEAVRFGQKMTENRVAAIEKGQEGFGAKAWDVARMVLAALVSAGVTAWATMRK